ncbi:MAG: class I SAM-dependent methyltransferase [Actinomycetes bacterium]
MRPAIALFDALAADYDEHFGVPHRRAYDDLAWERTQAVLPPPPATVLDVGCGVGRWAERLTSAGYDVIGIEPAPAMADEAARRLDGARFRLLRASVEEADLPSDAADVVLAMGSIQYADDVRAAIRRLAAWARPGGAVCLVVDSLVALGIELIRDGKDVEAVERVTTRRGLWTQRDRSASMELFDLATLRASVLAAGLTIEQCAGLLVGASVFGRVELSRRLTADYDRALRRERALAQQPELADLGKQLFVAARKPDCPVPDPPP